MAAAGLGATIGPVVVLLSAGVLAVPLFRRLGLGSVLGYFAAGALVGPSAFGLFADPAAMLHVSELGVVMFLFLIGLELRPQKLWAMRAQIFGLGLAQVVVCVGLLTSVALALFKLPVIPAFIAGADGQKAVSILLFEDLSIVPLLALVAWLAPPDGHAGNGWIGVGLGVAAVAALLLAGRYLIDPFFGLLARARTREVLTAGALLVVLGAALLMEVVGLSMAMGTFLAGVMLSGSSYRHQVEADVEPFKGLLMGLFFLAVGMSLDISMVVERWPLLIGLLFAFAVVKGIGIYAVARLFGSRHRPAFRRTLMFAQGGEFAFVLYTAAASGGVISTSDAALFSTVIILSMALTPLVLTVSGHFRREEEKSLDGVEEARDLRGRVLLIGFGRFGQVAAQLLLSRGVDVSMIENDPDRIREAGRFGFRIFYGDGTRLDTLQHSGAAEAEVILVCVDDRKAANRIVQLVKANFPLARLLVRSYDRIHSIELIRAGVDHAVRETFDAALHLGAEGLRALGCSEERTEEALATIRRLDAERLTAQIQGGVMAGRENLTTRPVPEPLTPPKRLVVEEG
jgi:glutathione-regulated potassium-efflux system protein KefB